MAFVQRSFLLALLPVLCLFALQTFAPQILNDARASVQALFSNHGTSQTCGGPIFPRSETPLIMAAISHYSHYEKIAKMAVVLAQLGYPITLITGKPFEDDVKSLHPNIKFYLQHGRDDKLTPEEYKEWKTFTPGSFEEAIWLQKKVIVGGMPDTHNSLQAVFQKHREEYGLSRPIISLFDSILLGAHATTLGGPGIKADTTVALAPHPITSDSNDTFPFYLAKTPHSGPDAKKVHAKANKHEDMDVMTRTLTEGYWDQLRKHGVKNHPHWHIFHAMQGPTDHVMMLGAPEFEYPRSDLRENVHYLGALPKKEKTFEADELPSWWSDVTDAKAASKKVVAVSQGSVQVDLNDLLLPTIEALKDRNDVLLIATTVMTEPEDIPDLELPDNTRIAKFVPYDELLPHVDVLVNNGGYGAVIQSLNLGIPLVVAGTGQDKEVTNGILEWKAAGVNLGTRSPTVEALRVGIEKVLDDSKYKRNAVAISKAFARYDINKVFDHVVQSSVRAWKEKRSAKNKD